MVSSRSRRNAGNVAGWQRLARYGRYDDRYQVWRGAAAPLDAPWERLVDPAGLEPAGWLAVAALRFDHKRKRLDGAALVAGLTPVR